MPLLLLSIKNTYNNSSTSQSEYSAWSRPQRLAQKPELHRWLLCSAANLALTSALLYWLLIVYKPLIVPNFFTLIYFMAVFSVVFLIMLSPEQFNNCFIVWTLIRSERAHRYSWLDSIMFFAVTVRIQHWNKLNLH